MMSALIILIGWCVFSMVFAEVVPLLFQALGNLLAYLFEAFAIALKLLFRALFRLIIYLVRSLLVVSVFARLYVQECWRGPQAQDDQDDEDEQDEQETAFGDYEAALALLDLSSDICRETFDRAFKAAIKKAHPDVAGGSVEGAQAVIAAREVINKHHGWA